MEYIFLMGADWRVSTSFSFFRSSTYVKILIPLAHHVHRSTWFYQDRENPCKSEKDKASNLLEVDDYTCFHVLVLFRILSVDSSISSTGFGSVRHFPSFSFR